MRPSSISISIFISLFLLFSSIDSIILLLSANSVGWQFKEETQNKTISWQQKTISKKIGSYNNIWAYSIATSNKHSLKKNGMAVIKGRSTYVPVVWGIFFSVSIFCDAHWSLLLLLLFVQFTLIRFWKIVWRRVFNSWSHCSVCTWFSFMWDFSSLHCLPIAIDHKVQIVQWICEKFVF